MRLASREVCDDETWANTVLNRSSISVQERLSELEAREEVCGWHSEMSDPDSEIGQQGDESEDSEDELFAKKGKGGRRRKRLEFSRVDMVREFVVERSVEEAVFVMEFDAW